MNKMAAQSPMKSMKFIPQALEIIICKLVLTITFYLLPNNLHSQKHEGFCIVSSDKIIQTSLLLTKSETPKTWD